MPIRKASPGDAQAIAAIIMPVIREGATYAIDPALTEAEALAYWMGPDRTCFVFESNGALVGTYYLRTNQPGGGSHVCNCGFITAAAAAGKGIAGAMCDHAVETARARGYRAMQFNFVVSTNTGAIRLWQRNGFDIVGRLPGAFRHPEKGHVDALVMFRNLAEKD